MAYYFLYTKKECVYTIKRLNHLITTDKVTIDFCKENILAAAKGKHKRHDVKRILDTIDVYARELQDLIVNLKYIPSPYTVCHITDAASKKERILHKPVFFPDQCVHHVMISLIRDKLTHYLGRNCLSGIPNKGIRHGHYLLTKWIRGNKKETKYCLKCDIKKFYDHVKPEVVMQAMKCIVKDKKYLQLTNIILQSHPSLPLENYTSGWYANLVLSMLDRKILLYTKYYLRYADDFVVFSNDKQFLHTILHIIKDVLPKLQLTLKSNYQIFPVDIRGVDMLGYRFFPTYTLRRKRNNLRATRFIRRFKRKYSLHNYLSAKSVYGQCKWFNSYRFTQKYNIV